MSKITTFTHFVVCYFFLSIGLLFSCRNFLCPIRGPQELGGPSSLNRLNPRFLHHCASAESADDKYCTFRLGRIHWQPLEFSTVHFFVTNALKMKKNLLNYGPAITNETVWVVRV